MRLVALLFAAALSISLVGAGSNVASAAPEKEITKKATTIKIQPGDSLSKIATEHESTIQRLFDANPAIENPDLIFPGHDLKIPTADEQLTTRPMPSSSVTSYSAAASTPTNASRTASATPAASGSVWDRLAQCESGGNWAINNGNGYYGGLQFSLSSWQAVGGSGLPSNSSRDEQIMRAQMLQARQGWGAWPACTAKLGIR